MHIDSELIKSCRICCKKKNLKELVLVLDFLIKIMNVFCSIAFFTKMYDESKTLISERKKIYDELNQKYSSKLNFKKPCLKKTRRKNIILLILFSSFSFSDCSLANSNSSLVCLNFFNLIYFTI